jgi:hypothetical protein
MKRFTLILFIAMSAGLNSCSTDFDINAPAKDITVVFGLLDQNDSDHYIRISKAFIGEQDALVMAQDAANSSYGDALDVKVEEYTNGNLTHTFSCSKTMVTDKDPGVFYYPNQEVYKFTGTLNVGSRYKIVIKNNESGKETTAETGLVNDFTVEKPYYNPKNPQIGFINASGQYTESEAKWESAKNGRLYEPLFRFNYKEVDNNQPLDTVYKYVDWKINSVKSSRLDGSETMISGYNSEPFYKFLESVTPIDYNKSRFIGKVDFMMSVGGDELSTYIDLNSPSNTIIQERPAYTNVSNGIGIFSCRHTKSLSFNLSSYSVYELINGQYTYQLGFH